MATLLIVEDDKQTNEAICEYLKSAGHKIVPAFDGVEALKIFEQGNIDLVILDIMLPKITGLAVFFPSLCLRRLKMNIHKSRALTNRRTTTLQNRFLWFCLAGGLLRSYAEAGNAPYPILWLSVMFKLISPATRPATKTGK